MSICALMHWTIWTSHHRHWKKHRCIDPFEWMRAGLARRCLNFFICFKCMAIINKFIVTQKCRGNPDAGYFIPCQKINFLFLFIPLERIRKCNRLPSAASIQSLQKKKKKIMDESSMRSLHKVNPIELTWNGAVTGNRSITICIVFVV